MTRLHHRIIIFILAGIFIAGYATAAASATPEGSMNKIVGTVVRFTAGSAAIDVTINQDNPAVRDFLSMLPLTL